MGLWYRSPDVALWLLPRFRPMSCPIQRSQIASHLGFLSILLHYFILPLFSSPIISLFFLLPLVHCLSSSRPVSSHPSVPSFPCPSPSPSPLSFSLPLLLAPILLHPPLLSPASPPSPSPFPPFSSIPLSFPPLLLHPPLLSPAPSPSPVPSSPVPPSPLPFPPPSSSPLIPPPFLLPPPSPLSHTYCPSIRIRHSIFLGTVQVVTLRPTPEVGVRT